MRKQRLLLTVAAVSLIVLTAGVILRLHKNQKLGKPGVVIAKAQTESGFEVVLPEKVLNYTSEKGEPLPEELGILPKDTTYGRRMYQAPDKFQILVNVVLMGDDRTSIHRPEFCLTGQGWRIDKHNTTVDMVKLPSGEGNHLKLNKMFLDKELQNVDGSKVPAKGLYLFWFAADGKETPAQWERMWWMAGDLIRTGTLQRWAYVACFTYCQPGQENQVAERMKEFIAAAAPEFQISAGARQGPLQ